MIKLPVFPLRSLHPNLGDNIGDSSNANVRPYRMYIAYLDESTPQESKYHVVGGLLLHDGVFDDLEWCLSAVIESCVPEGMRKTFEFHASELHNRRGLFKDMTQPQVKDILESCVGMIANLAPPIFYAAIDNDKHKLSMFGNAPPVTVGFRDCLDGLEIWFERNASKELGMVVFDNIDSKDVRMQVLTAYREYRARVTSAGGSRGKLKHLHDDLYFGDSAYSYGIQAADVCAYLINRHLNGRENTEYLYEELEPAIVHAKLIPDSNFG